jgi:hypothetical protein
MYYKLICIFYALLCGQNFILVKSGCYNVPQGVIKIKKKEFQDLKQGTMSVNEYVTKFTQLSRYAPHEVDTDEKKKECFLNGLNDELAYALEA